MHDANLEDRIRQVLRAEGDSIPFKVTQSELRGRLESRRRDRTSRRVLYGTAAALVLAVGGLLGILAGRQSGPPVGTIPSAASFPTTSPTPLTSPNSSTEATPSLTDTPHPSDRASGPLGAPNDAVIVRALGDILRPTEIEVSLVTLDAWAFETRLQPRVITRIPGSAIPEGYEYVPASNYGQDDWLAVGVSEVAASHAHAVLIFDLRAPDVAPWLVPGRLGGSAWGPGSVLAVADEGEIRLYDANGQTSRSIAVPAGVVVSAEDSPAYSPPTWLADGSGFFTWKGDIERTFGRLGLDGAYAESDTPLPIFQSTGRERRWAPDGSELGGGCPLEGGPEGCSVSSALDGGAPVVWYSEGSGDGAIQDYSWDAMGDGVWLLRERVTGEGPLVYVLAHADAPGNWTELATMSLDPPSDGGFEILGIGDSAPTLDGRNLLIGPQSANVQVAVSGDGSVGQFAPQSFFAGWAGDQGPYPAR